MKKNLFVIGAVALIFLLAACRQDSLTINPHRPDIPNNVTVEASEDGNWAIVRWRAGGNTDEGLYQIVMRHDNANHEPMATGWFGTSQENWEEWFRDVDPDGEERLSLWENGMSNRYTVTWSGSTPVFAPASSINNWVAIVSLVDRVFSGEAQIGVRALAGFNAPNTNTAPSDVQWASRRQNFRALVPVERITLDYTLNVAAETAINLTNRITVVPANATFANARRWYVEVDRPAVGWQPVENTFNGTFTPRFDNIFRAGASIIHQGIDTGTGTTEVAPGDGGAIPINVSGTAFVPVTEISVNLGLAITTLPIDNGLHIANVGSVFNLGDMVTVDPFDATNRNITWIVQRNNGFEWRDIAGGITAGGTLTVPQNEAGLDNRIRVIARVRHGTWWEGPSYDEHDSGNALWTSDVSQEVWTFRVPQ